MDVVPRLIAPADHAKKQINDNQWKGLPNAQARHPKGLNEITEPDKFLGSIIDNIRLFKAGSFSPIYNVPTSCEC